MNRRMIGYNQLHIVTNHPTHMRYVVSMSSEEFHSQREAGWTNERTNGQTEKVHAPILWYEGHKNIHGIKCLSIYLVCESPEWGNKSTPRHVQPRLQNCNRGDIV
jgi:hypothetical protein